MRLSILIAAALFLAACARSGFDEAQDRAAFLEKNGGSLDEICEARQDAVKATVDERRPQDYRLASSKAALACQKAALERL